MIMEVTRKASREELIKRIEKLEKEIEQQAKEIERKDRNIHKLNLDKIQQQKEIEELKKYEEGYKLLNYSLDNYISKDKIKSKIEEYNKMINATYEDLTHFADYRRDVCFEIKNVLNELLEE